jgi:organic radical activating enzyme
MKKLFNTKICKLPLQIQLFTTSECNRNCSWCIEKENCQYKWGINNKLFLKSLRLLLWECRMENIPFNVVITGGEPLVKSNENLLTSILEDCCYIMPKEDICYSSDTQKPVRCFKIGINTNGDFQKGILYHNRLSYVDITYIDKLKKANEYLYFNEENKHIRLQTIYRKSVFPTIKECKLFIDKCIKYKYASILFRELVGEHSEKVNILEIENEISKDSDFKFKDYQINPYDLWVKYIYKNKEIYFKKQNLEVQRLYERFNMDKITSIVIFPDGIIRKSWDKNNFLKIK